MNSSLFEAAALNAVQHAPRTGTVCRVGFALLPLAQATSYGLGISASRWGLLTV